MKKRALEMMALAAFVSVPAFAATAYINQVGYRTADYKELSLVDANGNVDFVDASGKTVLSVTPKSASYWDASGQNVARVDFSDLKTAGKYTVKVGGQVLRSDLVIKDKTYEDVVKAAVKWFYYQRASMALEEQYAGQWKRAAGHMDQNVQLHNSTGASGSINSPKGWYDAGDFGKYIVNSGITTYTLLSLYEHFPDYFKSLRWNIPAEGSLPDLLAEIKYNLDWMLTMQANDGGVYHKLTALGFPGDIMPAQDTDARYVIGKGTAATFDFLWAARSRAARMSAPPQNGSARTIALAMRPRPTRTSVAVMRRTRSPSTGMRRWLTWRVQSRLSTPAMRRSSPLRAWPRSVKRFPSLQVPQFLCHPAPRWRRSPVP